MYFGPQHLTQMLIPQDSPISPAREYCNTGMPPEKQAWLPDNGETHCMMMKAIPISEAGKEPH